MHDVVRLPEKKNRIKSSLFKACSTQLVLAIVARLGGVRGLKQKGKGYHVLWRGPAENRISKWVGDRCFIVCRLSLV